MADFKRKTAWLLICIIALIVAFSCCFSVRSAGAESAVNGTYSGVYAEIDEYLESSSKNARIPALSAIIVDKDGVLFSESYGDCNSADTPYLLGSVSKSFTALCIKKLEEEGKIGLNERISKYIAGATDGDKVTVIQLLNHTSGFGEHQNLTNYKVVGEQGKHVYSNVNYSLLGKIIEAVSGQTYDEYLTRNVLNPLGMTKTAVTLEKYEQNGLIQGYRNVFGFNVKSAPLYPVAESAWIQPAAGYISSSANDMGKYLQLYLNGGKNIISADGVKDMFYNGVDVAADIPYKYAMGWNLINEPLPEPALRHSGLVETGMACIYILPESGLGVAVLANYNDYFVGQDMMDRLNWSVVLMLTGMQPNEIGGSEFVWKHILYDFIYLIVFAIAVVPFCLLKLFKNRLNSGKIAVKIVLTALLHAVLPTLILLIPLTFFATPLWVVSAFVPDLFWTLIVSSCLLYACGAIKGVMLILNNIKGVK